MRLTTSALDGASRSQLPLTSPRLSSTDAAPSGPESQLAGALLGVAQPAIHHLASRLLELQEAQAALVETVLRNKADLLENSPEWQQAAAVLARVPEYQQKAARIRKTQAATAQLVARTERAALALRARIEERDRDRATKKDAASAAFGTVSAR
jgi:hypothetical protein